MRRLSRTRGEEFADSVREEVQPRAVIGWQEPIVYQAKIKRAAKGSASHGHEVFRSHARVAGESDLCRVPRQARNHSTRRCWGDDQRRDNESSNGSFKVADTASPTT